MTERPLSTEVHGFEASVLDHASEFVDLVCRQARAEYERLLETGRFRRELAAAGGFNHGKLFAYAEFRVFRGEFLERFPESTPAACVNAFSGLFLKNDISISNLIEFVEGAGDREQLLLDRSAGDTA